MITTPLIPVMISLNTFYQQQRKGEESRRRQREQEEKSKPNYNGTSCVEVVYENVIECCFVSPIPPETPAIMICNVLSR